MKISILLILAALLVATSAHCATIKIGGSGSMIPLVTELAKGYMKKNPKETVEVNQKSLGQPGGIAALNAGAIDIAMSAMPLTPEQEKLPIKPYEIAQVGGVIAVSADVTVTGLTSKQMCDIFEGKVKSWKQVGGADAPITVLTRPESDSAKIMFRKAWACSAALKDTPDAMNLPKSKDMHDALAAKKGAIGMADTIAVHDSGGKFKSIKIDGKGPEMLSSGWPFVLRNHLVVGKDKGQLVKEFMQFVKSSDGVAIIKKDKAAPLTFNFQP